MCVRSRPSYPAARTIAAASAAVPVAPAQRYAAGDAPWQVQARAALAQAAALLPPLPTLLLPLAPPPVVGRGGYSSAAEEPRVVTGPTPETKDPRLLCAARRCRIITM